MRRKLTQRGKDRRRQLMDHAAALFAERGYHPTSVADIVETLGVGKGVFYWYFPSKEELRPEAAREADRAPRPRQQRALGEGPTPVGRIEPGIRATTEWFLEHRKNSPLSQFAPSDERSAPVLRRNHDVAIADAARHIKEAI